MLSERLKFAVLIDGDNVSSDVVERLLSTVELHGEATIRRVYGGQQLLAKKWSDATLKFALSQGRRCPQANAHNATDIEMVIDAMDILKEDVVDGFCLVSSDADFAPLALRLREAGKIVHGYGEKKASEGFRRACHQFFLIALRANRAAGANVVPFAKPTMEHAVATMRQAIAKHAGEEGWAQLSSVGTELCGLIPAFSTKHYGAKNLSKLVQKAGCFELQRTPRGDTVMRPRSQP